MCRICVGAVRCDNCLTQTCHPCADALRLGGELTRLPFGGSILASPHPFGVRRCRCHVRGPQFTRQLACSIAALIRAIETYYLWGIRANRLEAGAQARQPPFDRCLGMATPAEPLRLCSDNTSDGLQCLLARMFLQWLCHGIALSNHIFVDSRAPLLRFFSRSGVSGPHLAACVAHVGGSWPSPTAGAQHSCLFFRPGAPAPPSARLISGT